MVYIQFIMLRQLLYMLIQIRQNNMSLRTANKVMLSEKQIIFKKMITMLRFMPNIFRVIY